MENELYVLAHWPDNAVSLIGLQSRTEARSRACVDWQNVGDFDCKYYICRYDAKRRDFVDIETLIPWVPEQAPFTDEAWKEFFDHLNA